MGTDQYGNEIPADLVLLDSIELFDEDALGKLVREVTWYEANGILMASYQELEKAGIDWLETDPTDAGINVETDEILRIADGQKRWSSEDGFYHA